jgi:hypothetical protein
METQNERQDRIALEYARLVDGVDKRRSYTATMIGFIGVLATVGIAVGVMITGNNWVLLSNVYVCAIVYFVVRWARRAPDSTTFVLAGIAFAYAGAKYSVSEWLNSKSAVGAKDDGDVGDALALVLTKDQQRSKAERTQPTNVLSFPPVAKTAVKSRAARRRRGQTSGQSAAVRDAPESK